MMRGYWERPELNQRAFYDRPVTSDIADRFYRTGDLVVDEGDGVLRFLGRRDRQIKVRGFRVELDEIEAVLAGHAAVEEAAAYCPSREAEVPVIAAAVTLKQGRVADAEALTRHAASRLPAYAVPQTVQLLEAFPRTTSGKIDRRALATLTRSQE